MKLCICKTAAITLMLSINIAWADSPSACTVITPAAPSVTRGSASPLLTATCNNKPTAWMWRLNGAAITGCATTAKTCIVPAASLPAAGATYNVTVTANNEKGLGTQAASTTITVTGGTLPVAVSACTAITPAAPSVTRGSASPLLAATCNNKPTAWMWKLNGAAIPGCATTASTCTVPAASLPTAGGAYTVTVMASNARGAGTQAASTAITVTSGVGTLPVAVSACTAITPAAPSVTRGSASPLLAATCNNTPTAWVWRLNGVPIPGCATTARTCTVPAASLSAAGGAYTVTVTANNARGAGTQAASTAIAVTTTRTPIVVAPIVCPQAWVTERIFDFAFTGGTQFMTIKRGQASAMKFTTGSDLTKKGSIATAISSQGPEVAKFMNISTNKCDFNYNNLTNNTYCATTRPLSATLAYTLGAPVVGRCKLQPNTTYYVNIRNEDARFTATQGVDSCAAGANCSFAAALGN